MEQKMRLQEMFSRLRHTGLTTEGRPTQAPGSERSKSCCSQAAIEELKARVVELEAEIIKLKK